MLYKKRLGIAILASLCLTYTQADTKTMDLEAVNGNWHLRIMDGMEVRKARAILDFDSKKMKLDGFDGCNRIAGKLIKNSDTNISSKLRSTRMECRQPIHSYVSKRLQETIREGFSITEAKRYGVNGISLKSPSHELFFRKMGK